MKYRYYFIIVLCFCFTLSAGCSTREKDTYIIDAANDGIHVSTELNIWDQKYFINQTVQQTKEFMYNDSTYNITYEQSIVKKMDSYVTNIYSNSEGVQVGFKDNTDQLVLLNLMTKSFFETEPFKEDLDNSDEYTLQLAKEIAKEYIDIQEYELLIEEPRYSEKVKENQTYNITYYVFTFAKKINNMYSSDFLSIKITSKGNLASILIGDLGAFENKELTAFSKNDIDSKALSKTEEVYNKLEYKVLEKEITYQRLVVAPNGKIGMYTIVKSALQNSKGVSFNTALCLLTYIE